VTAASVGTAGILNRCEKLVLVDADLKIIGQHLPLKTHPLYQKLREVREYYWNVYGTGSCPDRVKCFRYEID